MLVLAFSFFIKQCIIIMYIIHSIVMYMCAVHTYYMYDVLYVVHEIIMYMFYVVLVHIVCFLFIHIYSTAWCYSIRTSN